LQVVVAMVEGSALAWPQLTSRTGPAREVIPTTEDGERTVAAIHGGEGKRLR
jgi:hypothetical protein